LLIDSNGHLYGCGNNDHGQLGLGDTTDRTTITLIDNTKIYTDAACSIFASMVIYE
jgi:alpha-tubulin suppressor-like RCC1 family protein